MTDREVIAFSGGVGGAKLALGLQRVLAPGNLAVIVNTGDDFEHIGLSISPDIDTTLYTLAGLANQEQGWGRAGESWHAMTELERLGAPLWFKLGDKDLAVHLERSRRLAAGDRLADITADFARQLGVPSLILPMSNEPVRTFLDTDAGLLEFQEYFVRRQCAPKVKKIIIRGADRATAPQGTLGGAATGNLRSIVICPSNPYLSIDPILSIPSWRSFLLEARVPIVAVSPIVRGAAVKGPAAKIMTELGLPVSNETIARHYDGLIDGLIIDKDDAPASTGKLPTYATRTLMTSLSERETLAREALAFADELRGRTLHRFVSA